MKTRGHKAIRVSHFDLGEHASPHACNLTKAHPRLPTSYIWPSMAP